MSGALNGAHARRALYYAKSPRGWIVKTTLFSHPGYTPAHDLHFLFPVPNCHTDFLTFIHSFPLWLLFSPFFRLLPAFRLLLRARLFTCRRAGAVREIVHILYVWAESNHVFEVPLSNTRLELRHFKLARGTRIAPDAVLGQTACSQLPIVKSYRHRKQHPRRLLLLNQPQLPVLQRREHIEIAALL